MLLLFVRHTPSRRIATIGAAVVFTTPSEYDTNSIIIIMKAKDSLRQVSAGAAAGAVTKTLAAPLDRLKLVVQLRGSLADKKKAAAYEGPVKALVRMIQTEGILALWRGNVPTILINCGKEGLNFMFMDWYKQAAVQIVGNDPKYQLAKSFVSGGLAGGTAISFLYPIGVMRTKLALDVGNGEARLYRRGMRDVLYHSVRVNGISSLYQGYAVALLSVSIYRMVHLGGYDYCKTEICRRHGLPVRTTKAADLPFGERFAAAQAVSLMASTAHYPLDSVRRRLMMQSDMKVKQYRNGLDCFLQIYRHEGIPGYFRGLGTNYVRSVSAALLLVSYDLFLSLLS